jgi:FHA domain
MQPEQPDLSDSPEQFMVQGPALRAECRASALAAFELAHPYPWFVRDLSMEALPEPSFATAFISAEDLQVGAGSLLKRIAQRPEGFGFYPLRKNPKNPWKDRIIIGRATNNDVVLRHTSVSKVHARATCRDGRWSLVDAKSTNGTSVNGVPLVAGGEGMPLAKHAVVKLGGISCTVLSSADLHQAFGGRPG